MTFKTITTALGAMALFFLAACGGAEVGSAEHQQAVQYTKAMKDGVDHLEDRLDDEAELVEELEEAMRDAGTPDSTIVTVIKKQQATLATHEGLLAKYAKMVELHEDYIERHEKTALSPAEIEAQHTQINENYQRFQRDSMDMEASFATLSAERGMLAND